MALSKIEIIVPGQMTTIQDGGRHGYRSFGLPQSGFMDRLSARQANLLVSNAADHTLIEMIQVGITAKFLTSATIALTGADMGAQLNGHPIGRFKSLTVKKGDLIQLERATSNMISYLAIAGHWVIPEVLGSTSTFLRAKIGGICGRPLQKGDLIEIKNNTIEKPRLIPEPDIRSFHYGRKIRLLKSVESSDEHMIWLQQHSFEVTNNWDRMGIRLSGPPPTLTAQGILTSAVTVGTIQLPPDGQPIIVMVDGQTTGGYPRIATVIQADLPYLAQQPPGTTLQFEQVSNQQALNLLQWH